ncbi:tRNA lysidine(34) synthetase TilS [Gordonia sp. X0973]|uniref:tRNA lysidine(34) synthetase TilS n=1 Tax=Gordonia sp. X0973 TaxID=2742602 RepID=UPI000F54B832|nr:tRNA lysidine(34) synthetase TilS [Gordonia sp. X0973]QKT08552.1 tRNA lysidine(34) synthetase TilS [Gordonia sp. X0973]
MDLPRALIGAVRAFADEWLDGRRDVCVALSGGPDSLALTAAAVHAGFEVSALVVDHGLREQSARVADGAAAAARSLGADARVLPVLVGADGGLEAAARAARYEALDSARDGRPVLLGHTLDDQAETVLLGLGRGSGPASLSGMRPWRAPWGRPLLGMRRADTVGACEQWGLAPAHDPHNDDPRFTRVRVRSEVLPLLEEVLGGGVAPALARTADLLAADDELLSTLAGELAAAAGASESAAAAGAGDRLCVAPLVAAPAALRTRVLRRWLLDGGATEPSSRVVAAVDALVTDWRGRGPVAVGGDLAARLVVERDGDALRLRRQPRR